MRISRLVAAVAAVSLLGLAACTSDEAPEPAPLPSESSSPTSSASASPSAPTLPPEAEGTSPAAAKAFVRHWISTLNYAGASGQTGALARLSDRRCVACAGIVDFIDEVHSSGGSIQGQGWEVLKLSVVPGSQRETTIDALVRVHPQRVKQTPDAEPTRFPGGRRLKTFWLRPASSGWQVTRLDQSS